MKKTKKINNKLIKNKNQIKSLLKLYDPLQNLFYQIRYRKD
jgi:hypothetical protein